MSIDATRKDSITQDSTPAIVVITEPDNNEEDTDIGDANDLIDE